MKAPQTNPEKIIWESMRNPSTAQFRAFPRLMLLLLLFVLSSYLVYMLTLVSSGSSHPASACNEETLAKEVFLAENTNYTISLAESENPTETTLKLEQLREQKPDKTGLEHIVFGIGASAKLWNTRKEYIKLWWRPEKRMRGNVWLDQPVKTYGNETRRLPELKISGDTSKFPYKHRRGSRSAIRISRIVSETLRLGAMENVRWLVMGDDDTVFVTDNLVRVLNRYDHNQLYYIGSSSESHVQNINFSYGMAYGGGGFAISYTLAKAVEKMQDRCIQRYPGLYGSDDRMQACMAELGIPLTKELGFHQYDVYGNLFGLLAAHPVTPLVSLHHLDVVEPIFPHMTQVQALQHLKTPLELDSAGLLQQSICYDRAHSWTVSVSWGFAVQIFRGVMHPRDLEQPARTFLNWYRKEDYKGFAFNTRPVMRNPCQKPFVFYLSKAKMHANRNQTVTEYTRHREDRPLCKWKTPDPDEMERVEVYKKPDPHLWERSPRRNCCRVLNSTKKKMVIDVGLCGEDEISEI